MATKISESGPAQNLSHESIARRAYEIWQSEGCPDGRAMEHWLRAVSELKAQSNGGQRHSAKSETKVSQPGAQSTNQGTGKPRIIRRTGQRAEKRFQPIG